jgi:hypothetical protein
VYPRARAVICRLRWRRWPAPALALAATGCAFLSGGVRPVDVPALDRGGTSLAALRGLPAGTPAAELIRLLGEPADRVRACGPSREVVWRYPIRAWNDRVSQAPRVVPAPLLRIELDDRGLIRDWRFVHPVSGEPLPLDRREEDERAWFAGLSEAPGPRPPLIALADLLRPGRAGGPAVEALRAAWQPDLLCSRGGPVPVARRPTTAGGEAWEVFVDRPSPFFVPPHYLLASFDDGGRLIVWHFEQTYPGSRK